MMSRLCQCCGEPITLEFLKRHNDAELCQQCSTALNANNAGRAALQCIAWADSTVYRDEQVMRLMHLHECFAPSPRVLELVWTHSLIIAHIAEQLRSRSAPGIDKQDVLHAALAHDLGIYRCLDWVPRFQNEMSSYLRHGLIGGRIIRHEGFSDSMANVAERHTGVGISREDIAKRNLNLPERNFVPVTELEWLICYADKFHSKQLRFLGYEEALNIQKCFGDEKAKRMEELRQQFGVPDLQLLYGQYEPWHQRFGSTQML